MLRRLVFQVEMIDAIIYSKCASVFLGPLTFKLNLGVLLAGQLIIY